MVQFIEEKQKHHLEVKFSFIETMTYGVSDQTTTVMELEIVGFS